jgi:hypothetical protein
MRPVDSHGKWSALRIGHEPLVLLAPDAHLLGQVVGRLVGARIAHECQRIGVGERCFAQRT